MIHIYYHCKVIKKKFILKNNKIQKILLPQVWIQGKGALLTLGESNRVFLWPWLEGLVGSLEGTGGHWVGGSDSGWHTCYRPCLLQKPREEAQPRPSHHRAPSPFCNKSLSLLQLNTNKCVLDWGGLYPQGRSILSLLKSEMKPVPGLQILPWNTSKADTCRMNHLS